MKCFETFPERSLPSTVSEKKTIKIIGLHSRLRDVMGRSYPIYDAARAQAIVAAQNGEGLPSRPTFPSSPGTVLTVGG